MKNRKIIILTFFLTIMGSQFLYSASDRLIDFELKDQFDKEHKKSDYFGKIVIIVGSDRKGSEYNSHWVEPLFDSLKVAGLDSNVAFVGVANLGAVPFFMQSIVQGFFPTDTTNRILMDWDDLFAETYSFKSDHSNLALFGVREEFVHLYAVQAFDEKVFREILLQIKQTINKSK